MSCRCLVIDRVDGNARHCLGHISFCLGPSAANAEVPSGAAASCCSAQNFSDGRNKQRYEMSACVKDPLLDSTMAQLIHSAVSFVCRT